MLFAVTLTLAAAAAVSASPIEPRAKTAVLPLKHVVNVSSIKGIVQKGQARIHKVNGQEKAFNKLDAGSGSVINEDVSYVAPVLIGGKTWNLIVDTGSSNTWCGAQTSCEPSSTGKSTGGSVSVSYGSGSFSGTEYKDKVSFGELTVASQSIGAAKSATGFSGVDGIIGFGPQGLIPSEVLGVSFRPESGSDTNDANGELTLGGTDSSKYSGSIQYFPTLKSGSAAPYWGISIAGFTYGSTTLSSSGSGIVDTGTTLIYIPTSAYNKFLSTAGGRTDSTSGLAIFSTKPTGNFGIKFGSTTYTLTPAQYLIPTAQYTNFGLTTGKYYTWISDGGSSGVNTIIGQKFLENYYSVYDTTNSRIGFATAI
ncbi:putative aspartic proteinase precursor [Fusarium austroafricanum]|uniref:Putative aspartic proteinase n=1 Tax=Fusarium austroafricanum TaxID=2364996 RepID=A0A8H4KR72_9HYPO|nr:putative aspartic proteinase precursor [Fusarium austroafricanum]